MNHLPRPAAVATVTTVLAIALAFAAHRPHARMATAPAVTAAPVASAAGAPSPAALAAPARATAAVRRRTASAHPHAASSRPTPATFSPAAAGMVVGIDPETGELGPATTEQRLELAKLSQAERMALSHSEEGLAEVHHPNGAVSVDLQGRFQEIAVIHVDRNGRKLFRCVEDSLDAVRALQGRSSRPATLEEE